MSTPKLTAVFLLSLALVRAVSAHAENVTIRIYVATGGKDSNAGTDVAPVATVSKARDPARAIRGREGFKAPMEILIKEGSYFLSQPVVFDERDMGTKEALFNAKGLW